MSDKTQPNSAPHPVDRGSLRRQLTGGAPRPDEGAVALDVARIVRPVRRRMAGQLLLAWGLRGAGAALISAALAVAASHLLTWPAGDPLGGPRGWAILVSALLALAVIAIVARRWPSTDQAIREADRRLGLKDRLTTAREFAGRDSELIVLQRQELARTLQGTDLRQAVRPKLRRRDLALIALGTMLVLGATLLPNPQATAQAQQRQQRQVARYAAARTAALVHPPQTATTPKGDTRQPPPGRNLRTVQSLLRRLQGQLAGAKSPVQAIKTLTAAQQALQHLNAQGTQAQQSLAAAARALASGQTSALAKALRGGDPAATGKALSALAKSLPKLSAADRQAVAKALAKAATGQQGKLAQALQRAAQAAGSDAAAASPSLSSLAQQLQEAQASASAAPTSSRALQDLAKIKQDVSNGVGGPRQQSPTGSQPQPGTSKNGPQDGSAPEGSQPGKGSGSKGSGSKAAASKGSAGQPGKGSGAKGAAQGQQGTGQGKGTAQAGGNGGKGGTGKGSASGGQAGTGGRGAAAGSSGGAANGAAGSNASGVGSGQGSAGHGGAGGSAGAGGQSSGHFERVYLPGDRQGGPSTQTQGELGRSVQVQTGAFRQLVSQYAQAADSTLGRAALPPDRQAAVKRYFQSLEQN